MTTQQDVAINGIQSILLNMATKKLQAKKDEPTRARRYEDKGTKALTYLLSFVDVCYDDDLARRSWRDLNPDTQQAVLFAANYIYESKDE